MQDRNLKEIDGYDSNIASAQPHLSPS